MLELHKRLNPPESPFKKGGVIKTSYEKTNIQNQISATDKVIDKLVYELYDLTEEEIRIVKEAVE